MKNLRQLMLVALAVVLAGAAVWFSFGRPSSRPPQAPQPIASAPPPAPTPKPTPAAAEPAPADASTNLLTALFAQLRAGGFTPEDVNAFRRELLRQPRNEAIMAILRFLATGQDAVTGETFTPGENGILVGAPTLRVLLLDLLGQLCRETGGPEAATASRTLLERKTSADEWAVALRNVAWANPGDRAYLAEKTRELIRHQPWRHQPSGGYQEAFDFIVFTGDVMMIPDLSQTLRNDEDPLQTTAAITMDRLAEFAPLQAMNYLNQNPGEFADRPFLRADYFSKADLSQPAQRTAVEAYLARTDVSFAEKAKMIAGMASPGSFAAETLVTPPPPEETSPQRDAALRKTVSEWLAAKRFPQLTTAFLQLQRRIGE